MFEWVDRDVLTDVSINAVPVVIMAFFAVALLLALPWVADPVVVVATHVLVLVPLALLSLATYYAARAIERDAQAG